MRSREAWLAAMAAVLGVSDVACKKDATDAPAAAREVDVHVDSGVAAPSASSVVVASASVETIASATPSVAPSATAAPTTLTSAQVAAMLSALAPAPATTTIGLGNIGVGGHYVNPSCGATASRPPPTPNVSVQLVGGASADDAHVVQTSLRARLRNCAMQSGNPNTQGDVVLALAVDAHGAVTHVDQQQGTLDEPTASCMKAVARTAKLAQGATRTIQVRVAVSRPY